MRQVPLIVLLQLCAVSLFAQKNIPAFGKIDKNEFASLQCSYDPDAEAEILLNYASMRYTVNLGIVSTDVEYRVRIKILKEKGAEHGNISIPFYAAGSGEKITKIDATTYNADASGNVVATKLDKSSVYTKVIDKRWSEVVFSMPAVKVGSIIEYRYIQFSRGFSIDSWYFQDEIPTRISSYNVQLPISLKFDEKYYTYLNVEKGVDETTTDVNKSYTMRNVPGVRAEPYTSSLKDYRQKMDFALVGIQVLGQPYEPIHNTWNKIGEDLLSDEDFGPMLNKNLDVTPAYTQAVKAATSESEKMVAIYDHVRKAMTWNNKYSIWALDGIKNCWQTKTGNSGEINLILINLLKDAKLKAYPVMVSTRSNGRINPMFPSSRHFNTVMAYVKIDSSFYVLDATDRFTPASLIPHKVANTDGMVLFSKDQVEWVTLDPKNNKYKLSVMLMAEIKDDGSISGAANINSFGYSRVKRIESWTTDKTQFSEKYLAHAAPNIHIDSIDVTNPTTDANPFVQNVNFTLPTVNSGEFRYFSPNLFLGLQNNEFVAENRSTDIDFGYNQSYTLVGSFKLPDDYVVEELPKNTRLVLPDKSINLLRVMEFTDHQVNLRITLDFAQPAYALDSYADFHVFYKMLFDALNEQIVIHKKKA